MKYWWLFVALLTALLQGLRWVGGMVLSGEQVSTESPEPACCPCLVQVICQPCSGSLPTRLYYHITNINGCACLDGISVPMDYNANMTFPGWYSSPNGVPVTCQTGYYAEASFFCNTNIALWNNAAEVDDALPPAGYCCTDWGGAAGPDTISCSAPISFVWNSLSVVDCSTVAQCAHGAACAGTIQVTVNDTP